MSNQNKLICFVHAHVKAIGMRVPLKHIYTHTHEHVHTPLTAFVPPHSSAQFCYNTVTEMKMHNDGHETHTHTQKIELTWGPNNEAGFKCNEGFG